MRCDRNRQGGGVAIYVKDTISYKIRDDLPIGGLEIVCIEVQLRCSSPFIVLARYRPPNYDKLRLIELEQILQILDSENKEIILLGDTNCDELCSDTKNNITKLLESIYCNYQFKQTIKMSTRVTVPDHVTFLNQVTYSGNLVQTELPIERKPNQITFG